MVFLKVTTWADVVVLLMSNKPWQDYKNERNVYNSRVNGQGT